VPPAGFARFVPWVAIGLGLFYFLFMMVPPADSAGKMHLEEFAGLPVMHNGRVKPMDSVARVALTTVSGRQTYKFTVGDEERKGPPVQWLLDMMTNRKTGAGDRAKVIRIDSDQVLGFLGLPGREGFRYSLEELEGKWEKIARAAAQARQTDPAQRDTFQGKILELKDRLEVALVLERMDEPRVIPPAVEGGKWQTLPEVAASVQQDSGADGKAAVLFVNVLAAYGAGDAAAFNKALQKYEAEVETRMPDAAGKSGLELFFNHFAPFYQCAVLYTVAFLLCCLSWLGWTRPLARSAYWLALLTLVIHTWALGTRMYLMGRPPVTNLYSSAVFIGWIAVVLCLGVEAVFRNSFGTLVATFGGAVTMLIAHLLGSGDTMEMLQAVLDTNFWLATHVTCVTIGYATTYVAGLLGMVYIVRGVMSAVKPGMDKGIFQVLSQMIYGVICFAMFFSFVGTVLGGIWADQSWGRFWGWDPKENGALLIVIWNALILHARWAGLVRQRGVAVLAVAGNIITSWSWFGTNMLGIGLHAYGFTPGTLIGLLGAIGVFVAFIAVGLRLPQRAWR
jgi:ABC-type transport system involved in cytochrome c biogenesis permease subunit